MVNVSRDEDMNASEFDKRFASGEAVEVEVHLERRRSSAGRSPLWASDVRGNAVEPAVRQTYKTLGRTGHHRDLVNS